MTSTAVLLIIAIVGTTVAPWQLFFQQSNIVDKRITPRWINYERADTFLGSIVVVIAASALVVTAAFAFRGTGLAGHFTNAAGVARGLELTVGHGTGALFALVLLNASIIGAAAVTLSTSYAFGDIFGMRHSLHRSFADAKQFYILFSALVICRCGHRPDPPRAVGADHDRGSGAGRSSPAERDGVPALALQRQGSSRPWVNRPWLNALAGLVVSVLLALSLILMTTTVFRNLEVTSLALVLGAIIVAGFLGVGSWALLPGQRAKRRVAIQLAAAAQRETKVRRETWRMPQLALLERPVWSRGRTLSMRVLSLYLVVAVVLLVVKAVELGTGH